MVTIDFESVVEEAGFRATLIAGKRAGNPDGYFRHTPFASDAALLRSLAEETASTVASRLGTRLRLEVRGDVLDADSSEAVIPLLRKVLVWGTVCRWLRLTGLADGTRCDDVEDSLIAQLSSLLRNHEGVRPRTVPPA